MLGFSASFACGSVPQRLLVSSGATLASRSGVAATARGDQFRRGAGSTTRCEAADGQQAETQPNGNGAKPEHSISKKRHDGHDALPLSLYNPYVNLPCDGRTRSEADEACDPYTRNCQTAMHVWETNCKKCSGTGVVASSTRGGSRGGRGRGGARRQLYTCPTCHGLGCVRHTSTRIMPDVNGGNGQYTAGRPPCEITWSEDEQKKSLFDRFKEKLGG